MASKFNFASFFSFTLLVWVKSVFVILIGIGVFALPTGVFNNFGVGVLSSIAFFTFMAFIYTAPFFVIMLIVVYLTNRSKKSINRKKLIIYAIYATPIFIFGLYLLFQEGIRDTEFLTIIGFFLFVPAIMIYFTKLLPPRGQIVRIESREDLIDDISDF